MVEEKDKIFNIPVEDILPNRFQPRLAFDDKELADLSNSIVKYGIIQPIVLRKMGDKYEIIAGERRYKATVLAGLKTIPAIINNTDDDTSAEIALLENLQRKNLTVIEEAQSFKKLIDRGFTQEEIATKLGISQSSIANKIRLLNLPRKVQDALLYNKISERHARSLLSLDNTEMQLDLLDKIIKDKLTVKQTEDEISKILNKTEVKDDIPDEIRKFIDKQDFVLEDISENNEEKIPRKTENFVQDIPEVEDIDVDNNPVIKEEESGSINPFQEKFENSIKRIDDEIRNNNINVDEVINNDIKNNTHKFIEDIDDNIDIEEKSKEMIIPITINKVRDFVKSMDSGDLIKTSEIDLPDRYQIIIEISKK